MCKQDRGEVSIIKYKQYNIKYNKIVTFES